MLMGLENPGLRYSPALYVSLGNNRIYRRHTNFSMESIEQTFNGAADRFYPIVGNRQLEKSVTAKL
jgi:hypothetical protein